MLSILIPTYKRKNDILQNLRELTGYIQELSLTHRIEIIVFDNCSSDGTAEAVEQFRKDNSKISVAFFEHSKNVGLEKNAVAVLDKAKTPFVMFLGDDDFLTKEYLAAVFEVLESQPNVTCIVPSFIGFTRDHKVVAARDVGRSRRFYKKSIDGLLNLFLKGHQLSGLVFKREGTLDTYLSDSQLRNIYLFMFFVGFNCARGESVHLTEYPVKVSMGALKDWAYGKDLLVSEKLKNVVNLGQKSVALRFKLENQIIISSLDALGLVYKTKKDRNIAMWCMFQSQYLSVMYKVYFPFLLLLLTLRRVMRRFFNVFAL